MYFEDSYYLGVVKHLSYLFGLDDFTLQLCADFEFGTLRQCRVYCGMCIECWDCIDDFDSCTFDGKCHNCGDCQ